MPRLVRLRPAMWMAQGVLLTASKLPVITNFRRFGFSAHFCQAGRLGAMGLALARRQVMRVRLAILARFLSFMDLSCSSLEDGRYSLERREDLEPIWRAES